MVKVHQIKGQREHRELNNLRYWSSFAYKNANTFAYKNAILLWQYLDLEVCSDTIYLN